MQVPFSNLGVSYNGIQLCFLVSVFEMHVNYRQLLYRLCMVLYTFRRFLFVTFIHLPCITPQSWSSYVQASFSLLYSCTYVSLSSPSFNSDILLPVGFPSGFVCLLPNQHDFLLINTPRAATDFCGPIECIEAKTRAFLLS